MKKSIFLVVMVVVLVAMLSGSAFATRYDSGYQAFQGSPHGQYSTATTKCAACHAVHNPGGLSGLASGTKDTEAERDDPANLGTTEALLRGDIANACSYCHVSATFNIKTVYAENTVNYTTADGRAHSNTANTFSDTSVRCTDCHQVHGASSAMATTDDAYMYSKILRGLTYDADAPDFATNADPDNPDQSNITRWCTGCHCYYEAGFNSNSHVMTDTIGAYGNSSANVAGQVAWAASTDCRSCHQAGVTDQTHAAGGQNNYPHFTGGYRFLLQANSSNDTTADAVAPVAPYTAANDGTCLICHNDGTNGAGTTF